MKRSLSRPQRRARSSPALDPLRARSSPALDPLRLHDKYDALHFPHSTIGHDLPATKDVYSKLRRGRPTAALELSRLRDDYDETMLRRVLCRLGWANESYSPPSQEADEFSPFFKSLLSDPLGGLPFVKSLSSSYSLGSVAQEGDLILDIGIPSSKGLSGQTALYSSQSMFWQRWLESGDSIFRSIVCIGILISTGWAIYSTNVTREVARLAPGFA